MVLLKLKKITSNNIIEFRIKIKEPLFINAWKCYIQDCHFLLNCAILNLLELPNFQHAEKERRIVRIIFKLTSENLERKC